MPPPSTVKKKTLAELMQHQESKEHLVPEIVLIYGQSGAGKTSLSATAFSPEVSKRLAMSSEELLKQPVMTLDGVIWVGFDSQATYSLRTIRVKPEYHFDMATLVSLAEGNVRAAIRDLHDYIKQAAEAGATAIVVDTITAFGAQWLVPAFVDDTSNAFSGWQAVGNEQLRLLNLAKKLGLRQIYCAQPSENKIESLAQSRQGTDLDKAKAQAVGVAGGTNFVIPAISGRMAKEGFQAQCSMYLWLRARTLNGKKIRELLPFGGDGALGKVRAEQLLSEKEPPDLWALDQKLMLAMGVDIKKNKE